MEERSLKARFRDISIFGNGNFVGMSLGNNQDQEDNIMRWIEDFAAPDGERLSFVSKHFASSLRDTILKHPDFQLCLQSEGHTFVVSGTPGVGKTTLMQGLIDHFNGHDGTQGSVAISSMFYKLFKPGGYNPEECDAKKAMMRLLSGFVKRIPGAIKRNELLQLWRSNFNSCPDAEAIAEVISSILDDGNSACVILDGVDECHLSDSKEHLDTTLTLLKHIQQKRKLGIIITDRLVKNSFWQNQFPNAELYEVNEAMSEDICAYVTSRFEHSPSMRWVYEHDSLLEDALRAIMSASNKIFLLVWLNVEYLLRKDASNRKKFLSHLEHIETIGLAAGLPAKTSEYTRHALNAVFNTYLSRVFPDGDISSGGNLARRAFRFIRDSARPLQFLELRQVVAWDMTEGKLNEDNLLDWDDLQRECFGLIEKDDLDCVQFYHDTMKIVFGDEDSKEYLPDADEALGRICVQYLLKNRPPRTQDMSSSAREALLTQNPFLQYAAKYWGRHFERCGFDQIPNSVASPHQDLFNDTLPFLQDDDLVEFSEWMAEQIDPHLENWVRDVGTFALMRFAEMNHISIRCLNWLIQSPDEAPGRDEHTIGPLAVNRTTGLHIASRCGYSRLVCALLDMHKACECRDARKQTPLHVAAAHNQHDVIDILLDHGVDVNATDKFGFTPLMTATLHGHVKAVERLLKEDDIDVNARSNSRCSPFGRSSLHIAVGHRLQELVSALLQHRKIDANLMDSLGEAPIHIAARKGDVDVFKLLADDARVKPMAGTQDGPDGSGSTTLHLASMSNDSVNVVKYLLRTSPELCHVVDVRGRTALHYAARWEANKVVDLLMDSGIDINATDHEDLSALMYAVKTRNLEIYLKFEDNEKLIWDVEGEKGQLMLERAKRWGSHLLVSCIEGNLHNNMKQTNDVPRTEKHSQNLPQPASDALTKRGQIKPRQKPFGPKQQTATHSEQNVLRAPDRDVTTTTPSASSNSKKGAGKKKTEQ